VIAAADRAFLPPAIPADWHFALLAAAVALAGLPHGAADAWIARRQGLAGTPLKTFGFFGCYIGLSIAIIASWSIFPVASLGAFLALSVWHFGDDRRIGYGPVARLATGLIVLSSPAVFAPSEVLSAYRLLSGDEAAVLVDLQRLLLGPACLVLAINFAAVKSQSGLRHIVELIMLVTLSALAHPLMYFVVYFCALHSPRHLSRVVDYWRFRPDPLFWPSTVLLSVVSILAGAGAFVWLIGDGQRHEEAILQVVFIGLAALSVPHIILIDGLLSRATS
jgi:Brp/Blh family beta-carotene 15,15'-monooxygenase